MVAAGIRRGLSAGLLAGVLAGAFALVVGHEPMGEAMRIEASRHSDHADDPAAQEQHDARHVSSTDRHGSAEDPDDHHDPAHAPPEEAREDHAQDHLFSRATQRAMLPVAAIVAGLGLGGLFGLAFALLRPVRRTRGDWLASLQLGGVAWAVTVLAPALTVPANPPGVGEAADVGARTQAYLLTVGAALATAVVLTLVARRLATTPLSAPARQSLVAAAGAVVAAGLLAALPSALPGDGFPAELLWRFRLVSLGTQTLLWAGVAVGVGLLWERAARTRPETQVAR